MLFKELVNVCKTGEILEDQMIWCNKMIKCHEDIKVNIGKFNVHTDVQDIQEYTTNF